MTFEEFTKIGMAIKTYYPKEHDTLLKDELAIKLWYESLKDLDYTNLMIALHKWVETERWSPTIADLRRLAFEVRNPDIPTWDEAWETVLQAVRTYGYNRRVEAMDSFDEITRKAVSRIGFIQICRSEEIGIERAAFRDIYRMLADKTVENGQVAPAIRKVIEATKQAHLRTPEERREMIEEKKDKPPVVTTPPVETKQPMENPMPAEEGAPYDALQERTKELIKKTKESLKR